MKTVFVSIALAATTTVMAEESSRTIFHLAAEPEPMSKPEWQRGAQLSVTDDASSGSSWATKAALTLTSPKAFNLFNLGWDPWIAGRINRNTQSSKETRTYGADVGLNTALEFGGWGVNPSFRLSHNRDESKINPRRRTLASVRADLVIGSTPVGYFKPVGPLEFVVLPNAGLYSWNSSSPPVASVPTGRESGILGRLDFVVRGSQSVLSTAKLSPTLQRLELQATAQRWSNRSVSGGIERRTYSNNVISLTYKLYDVTKTSDEQEFRPMISLKRVIGENPEQGQPRQVYNTLAFELFY